MPQNRTATTDLDRLTAEVEGMHECNLKDVIPKLLLMAEPYGDIVPSRVLVADTLRRCLQRPMHPDALVPYLIKSLKSAARQHVARASAHPERRTQTSTKSMPRLEAKLEHYWTENPELAQLRRTILQDRQEHINRAAALGSVDNYISEKLAQGLPPKPEIVRELIAFEKQVLTRGIGDAPRLARAQQRSWAKRFLAAQTTFKNWLRVYLFVFTVRRSRRKQLAGALGIALVGALAVGISTGIYTAATTARKAVKTVMDFGDTRVEVPSGPGQVDPTAEKDSAGANPRPQTVQSPQSPDPVVAAQTKRESDTARLWSPIHNRALVGSSIGWPGLGSTSTQIGVDSAGNVTFRMDGYRDDNCVAEAEGEFLGVFCQETYGHPSGELALAWMGGSASSPIVHGDKWNFNGGVPKAVSGFAFCLTTAHHCHSWPWITLDVASSDQILRVLCEAKASRFCDIMLDVDWLLPDTTDTTRGFRMMSEVQKEPWRGIGAMIPSR